MFQPSEIAAGRTDAPGSRGARTGDARAAATAKRLFGIFAFIGAIAAATLALSMLLVNPALADGSDAGASSDSWWDMGGACNGAARLPKDSATCLTASWDNSPPFGAYYGTGTQWELKNECGDIGTVIAHIDMKNSQDEHAHLENSTTRSGGDPVDDTRSITCCLDKGDKLCIRQQVEPVNGRIKRVYKSGDRYYEKETVVNSQDRRYLTCANWPNAAYCRLTDDDTSPPTSWCGDDGVCDRMDCRNNYRGGSAFKDGGCTHTWISYRAPSTDDQTLDYPQCKIHNVTCPDEDGVSQELGTSEWLEIYLMDDFKNCDGVLKDTWCSMTYLSAD